MITHDLGVVAGMVDRVQVMYAGTVVESGTVRESSTRPRMPYTVGLLGSIPDPRAGGPAHPDQGRAALADQPADGLPLLAALPAGHRADCRRGGAGLGARATAGPPGPVPADLNDVAALPDPQNLFAKAAEMPMLGRRSCPDGARRWRS